MDCVDDAIREPETGIDGNSLSSTGSNDDEDFDYENPVQRTGDVSAVKIWVYGRCGDSDDNFGIVPSGVSGWTPSEIETGAPGTSNVWVSSEWTGLSIAIAEFDSLVVKHISKATSKAGGSWVMETVYVELTYSAEAEYTIQKAADFRILTETTAQKSANFRVLTESTVQKTADFSVVLETTIQKTADLRILGEQLIQKNADFRVLVEYTVQKSSDFRVIQESTIQKAADLRILGESTIQKAADLRVLGEFTIQKTANFRVGVPAVGGDQLSRDWTEVIAGRLSD